MRKLAIFLGLLAAMVCGAWHCGTPPAQATTFSFPCVYPFVGSGADVNVVVDAGGQYCDGPSEINWSHYHCQAINVNINIGAFGLANIVPGVSLGAIGANGTGGNVIDCHYVCPDGSIAPFPNPPAAWVKHLVLNPSLNDCDQHMGIRGPSSSPLLNQLPGNMHPGDGAPPGVPVPSEPGGLPDGQSNPPALPGPPPPTPDNDAVGKSQSFTHTVPGVIGPADSGANGPGDPARAQQ